jgi:hypothetical protein
MAVREAYKTSDGKRVPSVTTILSRFKESGGLLHWANQCGLNGQTLEDARVPAASAGTMAHDLVEAHINGRELPDLHGDPDTVAKARAAFDVYMRWQEQTRIAFRHTEVSLVSEEHRFGGRLDAVGVVGNELVLIDWKTSAAIYSDYLQQMAAYALLWEETYPDQPITGGFHLCRFAKDEGDFSHHHFPRLDRELEAFLVKRKLYDLEKECAKRVR